MHLLSSQPPPAWDIYAEELGGLGYGYPMWNPDLGEPGGKVMVGDIGYLRDGDFRLLFNCTLPAHHPLHEQRKECPPRDFIPFEVDPKDQLGPKVRITDSVITCKSSKSQSFHAEGGAGPANVPAEAGLNAKSTEDSRASLHLRAPAVRTHLECRGSIEQYMARHCRSWLNSYSRYKLSQEDIVFVYGVTETTAWEVSARRRTGRKGGLSVRILGECLAGIRAGFGCSSERSYSGSPIGNRGPQGRTVKDDAHYTPDQCVFIEFGKTKTRQVVVHQAKTGIQRLGRFLDYLCCYLCLSAPPPTNISKQPSTSSLPPSAALPAVPPKPQTLHQLSPAGGSAHAAARLPEHQSSPNTQSLDVTSACPTSQIPTPPPDHPSAVASEEQSAPFEVTESSEQFRASPAPRSTPSVDLAETKLAQSDTEQTARRRLGSRRKTKTQQFDPTDGLLKYILQKKPTATSAYVAYEDLGPLCDDGRLPKNVYAAAKARAIPITVVDGVSRIDPHFVESFRAGTNMHPQGMSKATVDESNLNLQVPGGLRPGSHW